MGAQRDHYEDWFTKRRGPRYPQDEFNALVAADAYDSLVQIGKPSDPLIQVLVDAASSDRGLVWNCGVDLLRKAIKLWPEVANSISTLLSSRRAHVRYAAMCCITKHMDPTVAGRFITDGLSDRSVRVRGSAWVKAEQLNRVDLIPFFVQAMSVEKNLKERKLLDYTLRQLRDGYVLESTNGGYSLWVRGFGTRLVPEAELKAKGVELLVSECLARRSPEAG